MLSVRIGMVHDLFIASKTVQIQGILRVRINIRIFQNLRQNQGADNISVLIGVLSVFLQIGTGNIHMEPGIISNHVIQSGIIFTGCASHGAKHTLSVYLCLKLTFRQILIRIQFITIFFIEVIG